MNWIEYVHVSKVFRARFGQMPPSILTEDGALHHMRAVLESMAGDDRADRRDATSTARDGGQPARGSYLRPEASDRDKPGH